jgi:hypothetical protein
MWVHLWIRDRRNWALLISMGFTNMILRTRGFWPESNSNQDTKQGKSIINRKKTPLRRMKGIWWPLLMTILLLPVILWCGMLSISPSHLYSRLSFLKEYLTDFTVVLSMSIKFRIKKHSNKNITDFIFLWLNH